MPTVAIQVHSIKHRVPDRVKSSFVTFDIRALWCSRLNPVCSVCFLAVPIWQQCRQWHAEVRPRSVSNSTRWAPLAGRAREDHLQAGCHSVPQPAASGTSPHQPSHPASDVTFQLIPWTNNFPYGRRAFSTAGPTVWKSLPRTNSEIWHTVQTVLNSPLRQSCSVSNNVTGTLEVSLHDKCYNKFTIYRLVYI